MGVSTASTILKVLLILTLCSCGVKPFVKGWSEDQASCQESYGEYGGRDSSNAANYMDSCYQGLGGMLGASKRL